MSHGLTLALSIVAFVALCLSLERHQEDVLGRSLARAASRGLRLGGWLALAAALAVAVQGQGWALGTVAWFGHLSAGAGLVVLALVAHGRRAR